MKRIIILFFYFCIFCVLLSCRENTSDITRDLIIADTLLMQEQLKAATTILSGVERKQKNNYEYAYYALLKTKLMYQQYEDIVDCSLIDIAVKYFKENKDEHKLADSYFYKAEILYQNEKYKDAIFAIKEAEYLAKKLNDVYLLHKVYMKLFYYNSEAREFHKALVYAKKENEYAKLIDSDKYLAYSYLSIAIAYDDLNQKDSMSIFALKFVPLLDKIDNDANKAFFYHCLGDVFFETDMEKALSYYNKAFERYVLPQTCAALADIYLIKGDTLNSSKMIDSVLKCDVPEVKIDLLKKISETALKNNDAKSVYKFMTKLIKEINSQNKDLIEDKTLEFQHLAEIQKENEIWHLKIYIISVIGIILLFFGIIYIVYTRLKRVRKDKKIIEYQIIIKELQTKISEDKNNLKLKELLEKYMQPFNRGKELFKEIESGGNFGRWTNNDLIEYINYCKLEHGAFLTKLNEDYENLSLLQTIYMLQKEMKISDEIIAKRLVIDINSLATYRSRIEKKHGKLK